MANVLANLARVRSATTGTGSLALGAAVTGALTFTQAGVSDGSAVTYAIEDYDNNNLVTAREIGRGTFSGSTLTRDSVYASTNAGSKINCSGRQHVFITAAKEDFDSFLTTSAASSAYQPLDADLTTLAASITAFGHSLVDDEDAATARTTLGLGTGDSPQFTSVNLGHASDTTLTRVSAGLVAVEGNTVAMLNTANVFTQNQTIAKASANMNVGASSGDGTHYVSAVAGSAATIRWSNYVTPTSVSDRWLFGKSNAAESGSDAGSSFDCYYYTDAGAFKGVAFQASRVDGSFNWRGGQYSNGVTGGSKGAGTINFATLYEGGTSLAAKYQPLDGDLTALAALSGTNTIYYRSAANTWTAVTIGANLSFSGGTLSATGGGGLSDADYGDITVSGVGTVMTIDAGAVTYAKIQDVTANSVLARAAGTDGDVSAVALSASQLLGRGASGDVAAITLGTNLSMSGTTLNASGGGITLGQAVASQSMMAMN